MYAAALFDRVDSDPITATPFDDEPAYDGFENVIAASDDAMKNVLIADLGIDDEDEYTPTPQDLAAVELLVFA